MDCPRKQKLGQSNNGLSSGYKISQDGLGKVLLIHISGCCNPSSPSPAGMCSPSKYGHLSNY